MAHALALAAACRASLHEAVRAVIVCGCALALIAAGNPLPF